jgi:hypothetical protein
VNSGVVEGEDLPRPPQQLVPGRGELDPSRRAVEQPYARRSLEGPDVTAEHLLRDVEPGRCPAEVQFLCDRDKVPQQLDIEVLGHVLFIVDSQSICVNLVQPVLD